MIEKAKEILNKNWRDGFTIPTSKLYPFQWNWDSGFVALGLSSYDLDRAMQEIRSLFSGQWENGMLPHILFHSENETTYFPNYDFWECHVNDGAPQTPKSSGITQPPVFGFVLEEILNQHPDNAEVIEFVKEIYPKLIQYHQFLYEYRDPESEGLFFIFHPWESGRDNSPLWDESLERIHIAEGSISDYVRKDTDLADASERPTQEQYDRYVYLLELGKKYKYDGKEIAEESPFLVQDCMMNAILIKSNESLISISEKLNLDSDYIKEKQKLSKQNFRAKFWNSELSFFVSYDLRAGVQMRHREIGGLIALYADVATIEQADQMAKYLQDIHDKGYYLCPSFDIDSPFFDSKRYWRGPVWPQMNWMVYHGLRTYGYNDLAHIVKSDLVELVAQVGFYEYFESQKSLYTTDAKGYGGNNFSWTASSIISLLNEDK